MKLRTKFLLLLFCLNSLLIALAFSLLPVNKPLFVVAELFIVLSIFLSIRLYRAYIKPLDLIASGIEMVKEHDFNTRFVNVGQSEFDRLIAVFNTMLEQLRCERVQQQEQHMFLKKLIDAAPVGIIVLNYDDTISTVNPTAIQLLGMPENILIQKSFTILDGELFPLLAALKSDQPEVVQVGQHTMRMIKSYFLEKGSRQGFILLEELTSELYQTEKNAYEKVIRVMSHEVNNSVGAINSILNSVLPYQEHLPPEDRKDIRHALQVAIERNTRLNQFMQNFADVIRTPQPQKNLHDLNVPIDHVTALMSNECKRRDISLHLSCDDKPFLVEIDNNQFELILLNILKNSIESIGDRGAIDIITEMTDTKTLCIRDTGKGISDDVRPHLFSPFYTTKKDGQGIGLTLIKEILHNHGFQFSLKTVKKGITEFKIVFE